VDAPLKPWSDRASSVKHEGTFKPELSDRQNKGVNVSSLPPKTDCGHHYPFEVKIKVDSRSYFWSG